MTKTELPSVEFITRALMVEYETAVRLHRMAKLQYAAKLDQAGATIQAVTDSGKVHSDLVDLSERFDQAVIDSGEAHAGLIELSKKTRQSAIDAGDYIEAEADLLNSQQATRKEAVKYADRLSDYAQAAPDIELQKFLDSKDFLAIKAAARRVSLAQLGLFIDALLEASEGR